VAFIFKPDALGEYLDYEAKGVLLALAHEFDMPAMTKTTERELLMEVTFGCKSVLCKKRKKCSDSTKVLCIHRSTAESCLTTCRARAYPSACSELSYNQIYSISNLQLT